MLTKEAILNSDDLQKELVKIPEWGGEAFVRMLTGAERDLFESQIVNKTGGVNMENIRARLVCLTLVDEDGVRLFDDADIKELGCKSASALDRVFTVAQRLNKISDNDVEDLAKN